MATPRKPTTEELAKPDNGIGLGSRYTNMLTPDDSVLESKGRDYRIYREVLRDDQCKSAFDQRRLAVIAKEWQVDPATDSAIDKQAADFIRAQLNSVEWDRITDKMLYARWYGFSVGECLWAAVDGKVVLKDVRVRDRSRFQFGADGELYLWKDNRLQLMPERKFWVINTGGDTDDNPYGLGLAHYCYWPVFFKRNDIKFWLVFLEKFGQPTAMGTASAGQLENADFVDKAMTALQAIATETAVLKPEGLTVELLEAARSGTIDYDTMRQAMDSAVAKIIVGQTASSQGTPGRLGNDELQGDVRDDLIKADADLICGSFNNQVIAWLTEWNFPGATPPRVWRNTDPPEDLTARAERDSKIAALGYEPTEEYITETYGEGWVKKAVQQGVDPRAVTDQLAQDFAEVGAIATLRAGHRADEAAMVRAAEHLASRYPVVLGERVQSILDLAEQTGDYATMQRHLLAMMAEPPPRPSQQAVLQGNFLARLMGALRQQQ